MKHSKQARIIPAAVVAFVAALVVIGWWMSHPGNVGDAGRAIAILGCGVLSVHQLRRFPKASATASPMLLCAAVAGIGVPFITASLGPAFTAVFAVSIAVVWAGIGIARARTPLRP
jgi:hypothetical protein